MRFIFNFFSLSRVVCVANQIFQKGGWFLDDYFGNWNLTIKGHRPLIFFYKKRPIKILRIILMATPGNEFHGIFQSRKKRFKKIKTFQSREISISIWNLGRQMSHEIWFSKCLFLLVVDSLNLFHFLGIKIGFFVTGWM